MPNFTFICEHPADGYNGVRQNSVTFEAETWMDVLQEVNTFLRGCGYYFDGEVGMIEPETVKVSTGCCGSGCHEDLSFTLDTTDKVDHNHFFFDTDRNR